MYISIKKINHVFWQTRELFGFPMKLQKLFIKLAGINKLSMILIKSENTLYTKHYKIGNQVL